MRDATKVFPTAVSVPTTNSPGHETRPRFRVNAGGRTAALSRGIADAILSHPRPQRLRHDNAAIGLLIVFHHGNQCPADGNRRAIERVNELRPLFPFLANADVEPARLVVGAVAGA